MLLWGCGLMIVLGLAGGVVISRNFLARLDVINRTSRQIMRGDLSQRVPVSRAGDEFDELAGHLNRMLDRIERLLHGMREVSDNVAHDLRSPLNRLRNRLEMAAMRQPAEFGHRARHRRRGPGDGPPDRDVQFAAADRRGRSRQRARDRWRPSAWANVIEGIGELYGPLADEKSIELHGRARRRVRATIRGNRNLISQAVANLVDNAIKYTPEGGTRRGRPGAIRGRSAARGEPTIRAGHSRRGARARDRALCAARIEPQLAGHRARAEPRGRSRAPARCRARAGGQSARFARACFASRAWRPRLEPRRRRLARNPSVEQVH